MSEATTSSSHVSARPMRCRKCDYPLWNLKARECPECGASFRPSEFEYVVNSVRFCCPDCDQAYYGIASNGQLDPIEFECVQCGRHVLMDEMVLRPGKGVEERQTSTRRLPWLERNREGWVRSWIKTVGMTMVQPHLVMRALPVESSVLQAAGYGLLSHAIFLVVGVCLPLIIISGVAMVVGGGGPFSVLGATALGFWLAFLVVEAVFVLIWGLVVHGLLKISGGATHSIGRTYQALCYSSGAAALIAVPCLGTYPFYFVPVTWWVVSAILMVTEGQRVHGGRATFATLTLPVLVAASLFFGYFGVLFYVMTAGQGFGGAATTAMVTSDAQLMTKTIIAHGEEHDGAGPAHAIVLLVDGEFMAENFIASDSNTDIAEVPVGTTKLLDYELLPGNRRGPTRESAVRGLPDDVIAHRLGDFVFTYHGIDLLDPPDPGLWIVIQWPDPGGDDDPIEPGRGAVGLADGSVRAMEPATLAVDLEVQNALRAEHDLAPLPHPAAITHDAPASPADSR